MGQIPTHSIARACALSVDLWGQTRKHIAMHACDNNRHTAVIMISLYYEGVTCIHAGREAGLHGQKAHPAGPTLERDDSAMEEAWVCRTPLLSLYLKLHVSRQG